MQTSPTEGVRYLESLVGPLEDHQILVLETSPDRAEIALELYRAWKPPFPFSGY